LTVNFQIYFDRYFLNDFLTNPFIVKKMRSRRT
jgi:hypothetical protein